MIDEIGAARHGLVNRQPARLAEHLGAGFALGNISVRRIAVWFFVAVLASSSASLVSARQKPRVAWADSRNTLTQTGRVAFIRRARIWTRTDVPKMNIRAGPGGPGAFQPDSLVTCDYAGVPRHGASRKFYCSIAVGDVVKVRYGAHNPDVPGSVIATRLLWALGFPADRVYPVRVRCRGCSSDPWNNRRRASGVQDFDPAVIERRPHGHEMSDGVQKAGWAWPELDLVDENQGGAPRAQRDALKLLAVLMQHTDTKPEQQRLLCLSGDLTDSGVCAEPFLLLHDVGLTFGRANTRNRSSVGGVNLAEWARTPVWKDPNACIGHLSRSRTGTLENPRIGEAGRKFLASLLVQLSDSQLRDLFEVAQVSRRTPSSPVADWVAVFERKRMEIVATHCAD